jgi:hypothetical protein
MQEERCLWQAAILAQKLRKRKPNSTIITQDPANTSKKKRGIKERRRKEGVRYAEKCGGGGRR